MVRVFGTATTMMRGSTSMVECSVLPKNLLRMFRPQAMRRLPPNTIITLVSSLKSTSTNQQPQLPDH